ncbi:hypothetical protein PR048_028877 [Dryococelus australis]|uniref:RRM domain-containing protein n=1 Tax=Dryococelus australis TaxID=614101 RepID=A0ABQ9GC76_9NEOP|nr:hypothetical protein PR048_028877 [Dryococelus australis]
MPNQCSSWELQARGSKRLTAGRRSPIPAVGSSGRFGRIFRQEMCENMEDQNESKVEGDEGDEMIGNNESGINMEANTLLGDMAEEENQKKRIRHRRRKEKLPLEANHDWLVQVFSQYGTVDYVSIPKYRTTGKIKGFAFVEFHTPEEALKTLEAFGAVGCCLASNIEPEKLCSIVTFDEENRNETQVSGDSFIRRGQKRTLESSVEQERLNEESTVEVVTLDDQQDGENEKSKKAKKKEKNKYKTADESSKKNEKKGNRKRKHTDDSDKIEDKEEVPSGKDGNKGKKKQKHVADIVNIEEEDVGNKDKNGGNEKHIEVTITSDEEEEVLSGKDKKKRKRKRKHSGVATKSDDDDEDDEDDSSGRSKKENQIEVVDLEKNTAEVEKLNKRKRQVEVVTVEECGGIPEKRAKLDSEPEKEQGLDEPENCFLEDEAHRKKKTRPRKKKKRKQIAQEVSSLGLQVLSKKEWKRLRNKYLNLQRITMKNLKQQLSRTRKWDARGGYTNGLSQHIEQMNEVPSGEVSNTATSAPRFNYTPGVIVRIGFDAPATDIKKFKVVFIFLQYVFV